MSRRVRFSATPAGTGPSIVSLWRLGVGRDCCLENTSIEFGAVKVSRSKRKNGKDAVYMTRMDSVLLWD
ncbi:hypothetical protein C8R45DRAFT_1106124 [Mycena sanguinolenta]|nr:hypothetical protein C8R45DRAFT_1106124 [Mycena sanguinolenta]